MTPGDVDRNPLFRHLRLPLPGPAAYPLVFSGLYGPLRSRSLGWVSVPSVTIRGGLVPIVVPPDLFCCSGPQRAAPYMGLPVHQAQPCPNHQRGCHGPSLALRPFSARFSRPRFPPGHSPGLCAGIFQPSPEAPNIALPKPPGPCTSVAPYMATYLAGSSGPTRH